MIHHRTYRRETGVITPSLHTRHHTSMFSSYCVLPWFTFSLCISLYLSHPTEFPVQDSRHRISQEIYPGRRCSESYREAI